MNYYVLGAVAGFLMFLGFLIVYRVSMAWEYENE